MLFQRKKAQWNFSSAHGDYIRNSQKLWRKSFQCKIHVECVLSCLICNKTRINHADHGENRFLLFNLLFALFVVCVRAARVCVSVCVSVCLFVQVCVWVRNLVFVPFHFVTLLLLPLLLLFGCCCFCCFCHCCCCCLSFCCCCFCCYYCCCCCT